MPPHYFIMVCRTRALGLGEFPHPAWHKKEKERILKAVGVKVECGVPIETGEYRGTFKTVGDREYARLHASTLRKVGVLTR